MKKVMKQSGKALCYFLFYFLGAQGVVAFIIQFCMGMMAGSQARDAGIVFASQEEAVAAANNFYFSNMGIDLAIRAVFLLAFFAIFFLIRKKNVAAELNLQKTSGKKLIASVLGAVFVIFFVNGCLNLVSLLSQESMDSYEQASSVLYGYPLWQALLANSLLVPIAEEVVFRGLLFSRLQKAMPNVAVALITSVVFGLVHGQFIWMLFAFVVGLVLSFVRIKTGSILPTILMHVMINTYATLVSYNVLNINSSVVMIGLMVIGFLSIFGCVFLMLKACKEESGSNAKIEVSTVVI